MRVKRHILFSALAAFFCLPSMAQACECKVWQGPSRRYASPYILIGQVLGTEFTPGESTAIIDENGKRTWLDEGGTSTLRISVARQFRGEPLREIRISRPGLSFTDCDFTFIPGETYLLFDEKGDGASFNKCQPPIPVAEAADDLKNLEGILANRPQSILFGYIARLMTNVQTGEVRESWPSEPVTVVLDDGKNPPIRRASRDNRYQIAVSPGRYRVWLERNGNALSAAQTLDLEAGKDLQQDLAFHEPK